VQEAIAARFECHRCGNCCKGDGVVEVRSEEVERIAGFLGLPRRKFLKQYATQIAPDRWWLKDQENEEKWCIFLELGPDGLYGCRINPAKPRQCGSFPEKWRNEDSFRTCSGLRALMRNLREHAEKSD
jgi:Fe-S-cluster containining protein